MENEKINFEYLIENYIYPMLPVMEEGNIKQLKRQMYTEKLIKYDKNNKKLFFYPDYKYDYYYVARITSSLHSFSVLNIVYSELIYCNKRVPFVNKEINTYYKTTLLEAAMVVGICTFLAKNKESATTLVNIIRELKNWSQKTYEGRNIPFGFIVDFEDSGVSNKENYIDFLQSEHSAVFTDGVFSAVLLDKKGYVSSYLELPKARKSKERDPLAPTRFLDFANKCVDKNIGIVSLSNGNILLFRNKQLMFAYRNGHWVTYDWKKYFNFAILKAEEGLKQNDESLSKALYVSILDVSFAHSGGCIAVSDFSKKTNKLNKVLHNCLLHESIDEKFIEETGKKGKLLVQKNNIIKSFVSKGKNTYCKFYQLNNKLRTELMKLDGATVLTPSGEIKAVGAILSVKSGSEGGGRLAATKELSNYGIAIKISEDGEITGYRKKKKIFHF